MTKGPAEYQGPRSAAGVANWALTFLVDKVTSLTDGQLAEFEAVYTSSSHFSSPCIILKDLNGLGGQNGLNGLKV